MTVVLQATGWDWQLWVVGFLVLAALSYLAKRGRKKKAKSCASGSCACVKKSGRQR